MLESWLCIYIDKCWYTIFEWRPWNHSIFCPLHEERDNKSSRRLWTIWLKEFTACGTTSPAMQITQMTCHAILVGSTIWYSIKGAEEEGSRIQEIVYLKCCEPDGLHFGDKFLSSMTRFLVEDASALSINVVQPGNCHSLLEPSDCLNQWVY